jgi:hypothetical protein
LSLEVWLYLIAHQFAIVVGVSRNRAVKLWRGARARLLVFIRDAVNRFRESVLIDRRRSLAWSVGWIVTKRRVITWIGRTPDLGCFFYPLALRSAEACLLCVCQGGEKENDKKNDHGGDYSMMQVPKHFPNPLIR